MELRTADDVRRELERFRKKPEEPAPPVDAIQELASTAGLTGAEPFAIAAARDLFESQVPVRLSDGVAITLSKGEDFAALVDVKPDDWMNALGAHDATMSEVNGAAAMLALRNLLQQSGFHVDSERHEKGPSDYSFWLTLPS
jgi:hypothetical protein